MLCARLFPEDTFDTHAIVHAMSFRSGWRVAFELVKTESIFAFGQQIENGKNFLINLFQKPCLKSKNRALSPKTVP